MTCRCDKATWTEDQGPVCSSFTSGVPEYHRGMCISCFHDEACHRQGENMTDIHTCSYYCHRPECIKAQRDQMRDWIMATLGAERFTEMMVYKKEETK